MSQEESNQPTDLQNGFIKLLQDPVMLQAFTTAVWSLRVHHVAMMFATKLAEERLPAGVCLPADAVRAVVHKKLTLSPYMLQELPLQYGDCVAGFLQYLIAQEAAGHALDASGMAKTHPPVEFTIRGESRAVPVGSCLMLNGKDPVLISAYLHSLYYYASQNGYGVIYLTNDKEIENTITGTAVKPEVWHGNVSNRSRFTNLLLGIISQRGHTCQLLLIDNLAAGAEAIFIGRTDYNCIQEAVQVAKSAAAAVGAAVLGGAVAIADDSDELAVKLRELTEKFQDQYMEFNHEKHSSVLGSDESVEERHQSSTTDIQQELEGGDGQSEAG